MTKAEHEKWERYWRESAERDFARAIYAAADRDDYPGDQGDEAGPCYGDGEATADDSEWTEGQTRIEMSHNQHGDGRSFR